GRGSEGGRVSEESADELDDAVHGRRLCGRLPVLGL
ncbi:MAG: hypothetical protein AVDCRST_MAG23-1622, partial [uncultured Sphingosinicella sp.]